MVLLGVAIDLLLGVGPVATVVATVLAVLGAAVAVQRSDGVVLAVSHAAPADPASHPRLHNLVEGLCTSAGLPKPRLHVIEDPAPNALAVGRDPRHASVAVTTGLLDRLDRVELEGVLAHELSRIKSHDTLVSTLAVTLVGWAPLLAGLALRHRRWGGHRHRDEQDGRRTGPAAAVIGAVGSVLLLPAPLVARLMRAVVGPQGDAETDAAAVALTRYPPGLISALDKLRSEGAAVHAASPATAHLWLSAPVPHVAGTSPGREARADRLFDAHLPLDARVEALREL